MMLERRHVTALMKIRSRFLGRERVQAQVIVFLWEKGQRYAHRLTLCQIDVGLRKRVEAFDFAVPARGGQTGYCGADEAVFEGLGKRDPVFYKRSRECNPRRGGFHTENFAVPATHPWQEVLHREPKCVEVSRRRLDTRNSSCESTVSRVVRIRDYLNGLHD